jgi:hypothetical protein
LYQSATIFTVGYAPFPRLCPRVSMGDKKGFCAAPARAAETVFVEKSKRKKPFIFLWIDA